MSRVPSILYGTAWKEERTRGLVELALAAGFTGFDTANQRKHYHEAGVGEAVVAAIEAGSVRRDDLFLQSKFTHQRGQDHRLPYDPQANVAEKVRQSFESTLEHFRTDFLDSYVLHGPSAAQGFTDDDWEVWRAMERLHAEGKAKRIGVSNVNLGQLQLLLKEAKVKPAFVQNRCYARTRWDAAVRETCAAHGVVYQGFSLLTANAAELQSVAAQSIARRTARPIAAVVFNFAMRVGMLPLTGTSDPAHMRDDLSARDFELTPEDVATLEGISGR